MSRMVLAYNVQRIRDPESNKVEPRPLSSLRFDFWPLVLYPTGLCHGRNTTIPGTKSGLISIIWAVDSSDLLFSTEILSRKVLNLVMLVLDEEEGLSVCRGE